MSYHYKNSRVSLSNDEPVFLTQFIATFILPEKLRDRYGTQLVSEQLKKIGGLETDKQPSMVEQFYRAHKRRFPGTVVETSIDLELEFEVNVGENKNMYPYDLFRDWQRMVYNPNNGFQALKKDVIGSLTIELHRKDGVVLRKWYFPEIFPLDPLPAMELEYANEAIYSLPVKFAGDYFDDNSY